MVDPPVGEPAPEPRRGVGKDRQAAGAFQLPDDPEDLQVRPFIFAIAPAESSDRFGGMEVEFRPDGPPIVVEGDVSHERPVPGFAFEHDTIDRSGLKPQVVFIGAEKRRRFLGGNDASKIE